MIITSLNPFTYLTDGIITSILTLSSTTFGLSPISFMWFFVLFSWSILLSVHNTSWRTTCVSGTLFLKTYQLFCVSLCPIAADSFSWFSSFACIYIEFIVLSPGSANKCTETHTRRPFLPYPNACIYVTANDINSDCSCPYHLCIRLNLNSNNTYSIITLHILLNTHANGKVSEERNRAGKGSSKWSCARTDRQFERFLSLNLKHLETGWCYFCCLEYIYRWRLPSWSISPWDSNQMLDTAAGY